MTESEKIPFRFASSIFDEDLPRLSDSAQDALPSFLEKLQHDPYRSDILEQAETDETGVYAYEFAPGYVVYWRVVRNEEGEFLQLQPATPTRVDVLAIQPIRGGRGTSR